MKKKLIYFLSVLFLTGIMLSSCKKETGQQGQKGDTGAAGVQGSQGIQGATGEQGIQGQQGPQGNANVHTYNFNIYASNWSKYVNGSLVYYFVFLNLSQIDAILKTG